MTFADILLILFLLVCIGATVHIVFYFFILNKYRLHNSVYECDWCKKIFRRYQRKFRNEDDLNDYKGKYINCPYCHSSSISELKEKKWMKNHPKLKRHSYAEYLKVKKNIKLYKKKKIDLEDQKRKDMMS